jgi:hypothetical protein
MKTQLKKRVIIQFNNAEEEAAFYVKNDRLRAWAQYGPCDLVEAMAIALNSSFETAFIECLPYIDTDDLLDTANSLSLDFDEVGSYITERITQ